MEVDKYFLIFGGNITGPYVSPEAAVIESGILTDEIVHVVRLPTITITVA